jgi:hypothetical protein
MPNFSQQPDVMQGGTAMPGSDSTAQPTPPAQAPAQAPAQQPQQAQQPAPQEQPQQDPKQALLSGQVRLEDAVGMVPYKPATFDKSHGVTARDADNLNTMNEAHRLQHQGQAVMMAAMRYDMSPEEATQLAVRYNVDQDPRVANFIASKGFKGFEPGGQQQQSDHPMATAQKPTKVTMFGTHVLPDGSIRMDSNNLPVVQMLQQYSKSLPPQSPDSAVASALIGNYMGTHDDKQLKTAAYEAAKKSGKYASPDAYMKDWINGVVQWAGGGSDITPQMQKAGQIFQPGAPTQTEEPTPPPETGAAKTEQPQEPEAQRYLKYLDQRRASIYSNPTVFNSAAGQQELKGIESQLSIYSRGQFNPSNRGPNAQQVGDNRTAGRKMIAEMHDAWDSLTPEQQADPANATMKMDDSKVNFWLDALNSGDTKGTLGKIEQSYNSAETIRNRYATTTKPRMNMQSRNKLNDELSKAMTSTNGDLGRQSGKVSQGIHLMGMLDQQKDPQTGEYHLNGAQYGELSMGLASMLSGTNVTSDSARNEILMQSGYGDLMKAIQYASAHIQDAVPSDFVLSLAHSIDRQAMIAENLRNKYIGGIKSRYSIGVDPKEVNQIISTSIGPSYFEYLTSPEQYMKYPSPYEGMTNEAGPNQGKPVSTRSGSVKGRMVSPDETPAAPAKNKKGVYNDKTGKVEY